ncbi:hypothetical protein LCGC14_0396170 [marine sediment metagenome]|uniref:Uncharacterized protein n=1 Tax=marine sediment metagenome TaxID=412755 RepID=A0A0F9SY33_9ZZZZ
MTNYTADEIRDIILEKKAERYFGEIVLYFSAGEIYGFKDIRMNKKATEEGNTRTELGVLGGRV